MNKPHKPKWIAYGHTLLMLAVLTLCTALVFSFRPQSEQKKILIYTKNGEGYVHENIPHSTAVIKKMAQDNGYIVDVSDNASAMTEENLKQYQALVFSNTNNETFDTESQKLAFQRYIQAGGGFVSIHSACGSERQWPWFWKNLGGKFFRHAPGGQTFDIKVIDADHPSSQHLPETWSWEDECYYLKHLNPDIRVLMAADLRTVEDPEKNQYPGEVFGNYFPLSWYHEFDGGRQWHTSLGHAAEYYDDPIFQKHIMGGIEWVTQNQFSLDYSKVTTELITE